MKRTLVILLVLMALLVTSCEGNPILIDDEPSISVNVTAITDDISVKIKGKIDGAFDYVNVDPVENSLVIMTEEHHEVHQGHMYTVSDTIAASTTTVKWQIETANTTNYAHLVFSLFATGEATYLVTEGSDRTDGTALTEVNKRRVGTVDVSETTVTRTPTGGTTDGAIVLFSVRTGSTGVAGKTVEGGAARAENEYILRPATKYVVSITTYADGIYATMKLDWYEHED